MIIYSKFTWRLFALMLTLAFASAGFTTDASAGTIAINGVTEGQVVSGDVFISATFADQPAGIVLGIRGPKGFTTSNQGNTSPLPLKPDANTPTQGIAWDAASQPEGEYLAIAYSAPSRKRRNVATVRFFVRHAKPEAQVTPAPSVPEVVVPDVVEPAPAEPTTTPVVEEPAPQTPTTQTPTTPAPSTPAVDPVDTNGADELTTTPFTIGFAANAIKSRTVGDRQDVELSVVGELPEGADVLVIAWHHDLGRVVDSFAHVLDDKPWVVRAEFLDELPVGSVELQVHHRVGDKFISTAKHTVANNASVATDLPAVRFSAASKSAHTYGSTFPLTFEVDAAMPAEADVMVLAWSVDEHRLVEGFSQTLTEGPWQIAASDLDRLPLGEVEIQLLSRMDGKIEGRALKAIMLTKAVASSGSPDDDTETTVDENTDDTPGTDTSDTDGDTAGGDTPDDTVADSGNGNGGTSGGNDGGSSGGDAGEVTFAFASNTPSIYTKGSGVKIKLDVQGSLPAGSDILLLHWSATESQMIDSFAHEVANQPFEVSTAKLDALPSGVGDLQALLRVPGQPIRVEKANIIIVEEGENPDDVQPDDTVAEGGEPDLSDVPTTSIGFTALPLSGDSKVIYVSSSQGNDSNDGLSSARPVKSASRAKDLVRDGKPDRILFKAGDEWSNGIGSWTKSGRSASEKLVVGYYGNGARPKFNTNGNRFVTTSFNDRIEHVAFVGLHAYANKRDPNRSGFVRSESGRSDSVLNEGGLVWYAAGGDLLIEDCKFEYYKFNLVFQRNDGDSMTTGITVNRCIILNAYGHWDHKYGGHSSGIFARRVKSLLISETVLDHNGWNDNVSGAKRTKFNHNIYVQNNCSDVNVIDSVSTRGASHGLQLRSGGDVINSLFSRNALAFFVAIEESNVKRNVVLMSDDIGSADPRGFGIEILPTVNAVVENNVIAQKRGGMGFAAGIAIVHEQSSIDTTNGKFRVAIRNNKIAQWPSSGGYTSIRIQTSSADIVANSGNQLDIASGGNSNPPWVDPTRDVESYMASIGQPASLDAFIKGAAARGPGEWLPAFTSDAANTWIRKGFDIIPHD